MLDAVIYATGVIPRQLKQSKTAPPAILLKLGAMDGCMVKCLWMARFGPMPSGYRDTSW